MAHADAVRGGGKALPLYMFYHPASALAASGDPVLEDNNLVYTHHVAPSFGTAAP